MDSQSDELRAAKRIVVKVGSSLVTNEGRGLDEAAIGEWCRQMSELVRDGRELIMVSSGAIAEGMKRLGWTTRPHEIHELQAAAAVGQMGLAQMYETKLRENGLGSAQVLLTHADLADRERYLNARSTLLTLLKLGVLPVINENDTIANEEIKVGDNDNLSADIALLFPKSLLVLLTTIDGFYRGEELLRHIPRVTAEVKKFAGNAAEGGTGGMITKLQAGEKILKAGQIMNIASGKDIRIVRRIVAGEDVGTWFYGN